MRHQPAHLRGPFSGREAGSTSDWDSGERGREVREGGGRGVGERSGGTVIITPRISSPLFSGDCIVYLILAV